VCGRHVASALSARGVALSVSRCCEQGEPKEPAAAGIYCSDGSLNASYTFNGEQTINRAELAPILQVLSITPKTENVTIASDSLGSIYQIRNASKNTECGSTDTRS
jgi:ribonuclease HI